MGADRGDLAGGRLIRVRGGGRRAMALERAGEEALGVFFREPAGVT